jgi:UDP-glucose 4-epimerase
VLREGLVFILLGGTGFLGRHLRIRLSAGGARFVTVGRRFPAILGAPFPGERFVLADEFGGDVGDDLIRQAKVLVYLIGCSVPGTYIQDPWQEVSVSVAPAMQTMWRCATLNPELKIVFISSGGTVYGGTGGEPTPETFPPAPISGYGLGKLMIEDALRFIGRTRGTRFAILRVANPIGEYQMSATQGIVTIAIRAAVSGQPITLFGGGTQVRDYIDADDVADAIIVAGQDRLHDGAIWNIGSGVGVSVREMINLVEEVVGRPVPVVDRPARPVDVQYIVLDITRVSADLGWRPMRSTRETVIRVYAAVSRRTAFLLS